MFRSLLELSKKDVGVTKVTVSSSLRTSVTELLRNFKSFFMIVDCLAEVPQQVVNIPQVSTSSTLCCSILKLQNILCQLDLI